MDFCLICNEGSGDELVGAAMAAGAAGASIAKLKQINPSNSAEQDRGAKPVAREACYMIIGKDAVPGILQALDEKDCFGAEHSGLVITNQTDKAFTYLPPSTD